jgi:radical SAM superfamily enzyme YgiQ (UPF0313 family)
MENNIDVLYVHPTRSLDTTLYSFFPMGVVGLVNLIKSKGYSVYGINYGIEKSIDDNYSLIDELKNIDYKVLMLDLHWYEHAYGAIEIAKISKEINPSVPIIIGGITSTIFAKEILENFSCIDYILKGDSEKPLTDLIDFLVLNKGNINDIENISYRENNEVINKELTYCLSNLDSINYVDHSFLKNHELYEYTNTVGVNRKRDKCAWVYIGRGCKHNCVYCDSARNNMITLWGRDKMTYRSPEKVASDIIEFYNSGVEVVRVSHDLEMFGKNYYEEIFKILRDNNVKIGFNYDCFQLPSKHFIDELLRTFIEDKIIIDITLLSGNEEIRYKMGKLFTNLRLYECLDYLKETKCITRVYYSVNVLNEDLHSFEETMSQIEFLINRYKREEFFICYQRVVLDPIALMKGLKDSNIYVELNSFMDYYSYCQNNNYNYIGYTDFMSEYYEYKIDRYKNIQDRYRAIGYENLY